MRRTILRRKPMLARTGLSSTTQWRLERKGLFPKRLILTKGGVVGWYEDEVDIWVEALSRADENGEAKSPGEAFPVSSKQTNDDPGKRRISRSAPSPSRDAREGSTIKIAVYSGLLLLGTVVDKGVSFAAKGPENGAIGTFADRQSAIAAIIARDPAGARR